MNMMEWVKELHSAQGISQIVQSGGLIALVAIIFAETGLLAGFFLPGDSLLITAGVLANPGNPNHIASLDILNLNLILVIAAIVGDQLGFYLGKKAGESIWDKPDGRFYKKKHMLAAKDFYEKYGGPSVVAARYVPIFRTFVPFAAGMAKMPYKKFVFWNIFGGILWVTSLLWVGYFLGQTQLANRLDKIIVIVILVSVLPIVFGALKKWIFSNPKAASMKVLGLVLMVGLSANATEAKKAIYRDGAWVSKESVEGIPSARVEVDRSKRKVYLIFLKEDDVGTPALGMTFQDKRGNETTVELKAMDSRVHPSGRGARFVGDIPNTESFIGFQVRIPLKSSKTPSESKVLDMSQMEKVKK